MREGLEAGRIGLRPAFDVTGRPVAVWGLRSGLLVAGVLRVGERDGLRS